MKDWTEGESVPYVSKTLVVIEARGSVPRQGGIANNIAEAIRETEVLVPHHVTGLVKSAKSARVVMRVVREEVIDVTLLEG